MPEPAAADRRYIGGLDGLRALAVLAVLAYHAGAPWAQGGFLGVSIFFVLSGYLITDLLLTQRDSEGRIRLGQFWLRRARRLFPALWVMLVVVVAWVAVLRPDGVASLREEVGAALLYVSNWFYVVHHVSYFASFGPPSPIGHLWSLGVEEQFYLLWPLLLMVGIRFLPRRRVLQSTLTLAALSALLMAVLFDPSADPNRMYYGTDSRAFELLIGAALAFAWPSGGLRRAVSRARRRALDTAGVVGLGVLLACIWGMNEYAGAVYQGGMVLVCAATVVVVAALTHPATLLSRAFALRPLRWIGVRSYGIYLWHFPVIVLTTPLVDTPGPHLVRAALQVTLSLLLAALSWRFVEDPIRRLGVRGALQALRWSRWQSSRARSLVAGTGVLASCMLVVSSAALAGWVTPEAGSAQTPALPASVSLIPDDNVTEPAPQNQCGSAAGERDPRHVLVTPSPAAAPTPAAVSDSGVTAIGDSVMVDLAPFLAARIHDIAIDGKVSRQMYELSSVIAHLRAERALHPRLILELGTNGPFSESQLAGILRSLGPMQQILLVNTLVPRPWQGFVNQALASVARDVPHTQVVDWYDAAAGHPQWLYGDGVHPNATGARILAALIARSLHLVHPPPRPPATGPAPHSTCGSTKPPSPRSGGQRGTRTLDLADVNRAL